MTPLNFLLLFATLSGTQRVDLPAEIMPYLAVTLHAMVQGYVDQVYVDRASIVKAGEKLIELPAPETKAQLAELEYKSKVAEVEPVQAEAQLAAFTSTYERVKRAVDTSGAVAGNELIQAEKQVDAARAALRSREEASRAAESAIKRQKELESYLTITAPFDGVVTERWVHRGALAGPSQDSPLAVIQQVSRLRLVVPVPEEYVGEMVRGAVVSFKAPAYPDKTYSGKIARISHTLDQKTRTMPVELDVFNRDGSLSPGMYPEVHWPVKRSRAALLVPKTSVVTTTERVFVICDQGGRAEWVDVKKGVAEGDLVELSGNLRAGDKIVRRGTDEIHEGAGRNKCV